MKSATCSRWMALAALTATIGAVAAAGPGCGGGGGGDSVAQPTRAYLGTQSPGDLWSWALESDGTFAAENETLGYTYAGSYTTLPSAFLKLLVTSTTEPGLTVPATAYAFEVPDSALVIKPAGSDANVIVAVSLDTCPTGSLLPLSWVELTRTGWDAASNSAYGTADVAITGSTWDVTTTSYLLNGTPDGAELIPDLACAGGIVTDPAEPDAVLAMASSGVFIRDGGPGMGASMGMRRPTSEISLSDLTGAGREFRGFHYKDDSTRPADSMPVWARPDGAGGLWGGEYDDIEAGIETSDPPAQIRFLAQSTPGVLNAELEDSSGRSPIVFMVNRLGGRYFLFGISVDTHDGQPYNFVAIETGP